MTQINQITDLAGALINKNLAGWVVDHIKFTITYASIREPVYFLMLQREGNAAIQFFDPASQCFRRRDTTLWGKPITNLILAKPIDFSRISLEHQEVVDRPKFVLTPWSLVAKDGVIMTVGEHFDGKREAGLADSLNRMVEASSKRKKDILAPRA